MVGPVSGGFGLDQSDRSSRVEGSDRSEDLALARLRGSGHPGPSSMRRFKHSISLVNPTSTTQVLDCHGTNVGAMGSVVITGGSRYANMKKTSRQDRKMLDLW